MTDLILGQVLHYAGDPLRNGVDAAPPIIHGAVAVEGGRIAAVGTASALRARYPQARLHDHGQKLVSAGFVDAHVHYPQTAIIASWGKRLIDWLNTYTFPEEMRFADPAYAEDVADRYMDLALAHGTTSMCSYATIHPASVDAFFNADQTRGLRAFAGVAVYCSSKAALDQFIGALRSVALRAKQGDPLLKSAPHFAPRARVDETLAARNPVLVWKGDLA